MELNHFSADAGVRGTTHWSFWEVSEVLAGSSDSSGTLPKIYISVRQEGRTRATKDSEGCWWRPSSSELFFLRPNRQGLERNQLYSKDFWALCHQRFESQTSHQQTLKEMRKSLRRQHPLLTPWRAVRLFKMEVK